MELNRTASPNCDRIVAAAFAGSGATLTVTNIGCDAGHRRQVPVVQRPGERLQHREPACVQRDSAITYVWTNKLAIDGSIEVLSGGSPVNPTPTNVTFAVSGSTLTLGWPPTIPAGRCKPTRWMSRIRTSWFPYPGSTDTNQVNLTIDPAQTNVFYRLLLQ